MLTTRRALTLTAAALTLATLLAAPAARADMYTYTDPATGKRVISSTPPPEVRPVPIAPVAPAAPPETPKEDPADKQAAELLDKVSGLLDKVTAKGQPGRAPAQGSVDTRKLGNISPGMTQTSVRAPERPQRGASGRHHQTAHRQRHG